jgi:hypothetical protein
MIQVTEHICFEHLAYISLLLLHDLTCRCLSIEYSISTSYDELNERTECLLASVGDGDVSDSDFPSSQHCVLLVLAVLSLV